MCVVLYKQANVPKAPVHIEDHGIQDKHPLKLLPAPETVEELQQFIQSNAAVHQLPQRDEAHLLIGKGFAFRCRLPTKLQDGISYTCRIGLLDDFRGKRLAVGLQ